MKLADVEAILGALNDADVRYLIVGGLAVVAHGYVRYTHDVDIVLNLERANVLRAMKALEKIGYRPLVPVNAAEFADEEKRHAWITQKNMLVFQMRKPDSDSTPLDIFTEEPFPFAHEYTHAVWEEVVGIRAPVLRYEELINLKRSSGRPNDLADIDQLELLRKKPDE